VTVFAEVGAVYWSFALWAVAIWPAWLVLREFGGERETAIEQTIQSMETQAVKNSAPVREGALG
jgi:hypothetical protein